MCMHEQITCVLAVGKSDQKKIGPSVFGLASTEKGDAVSDESV